MHAKIQRVLTGLSVAFLLAAVLYAQNPISLVKVGTTAVGSTVPVSGSITANMGTVTADPFGANADAASATGSISAKLRFIAATGIPVTGTVQVQSNSANLATQTTITSVLTALQADPCFGTAKTTAVFSIASATTTQLVAASASNFLHVCSFNLVSAAANNVALVEDDTSACASPSAGMAGGTTAAAGWNFAANGGLTLGSGGGTTIKTAATNRYVCLITSGAGQVSGSLSYVLAP